MSRSLEQPRAAPRPDAAAAMAAPTLVPVLLIALLFTLVAQVSRTMFPLMYLMGEDWNFAYVGLIALAVYAAPLLALPFVSLGARSQLAAGTVAVIGARLAVQFAHPVPAWLAMAATAVSLVGVTLAVLGMPHEVQGRVLAVGVVVGLALDTALRAPFRSWDLAWQEGTGGVLTTLALVAATTAALVTLARRPNPVATDEPPIVGFAILGPFLALQLLFLQNLGYVGSQAQIGFAGATLVVLAGDALGLVVLSLAGHPGPSRAAVGAAGLAATILGGSVTAVAGAWTVLLVLALQTLAIGLLAVALPDRRTGSGRRRTATATLGASLSFVVLTFLWMIEIDMPLPFPREVVPAAVALALGIAALRHVGAVDTDVRGATVRLLAAVVALIALALPGWLWLDRPSDDVEPLTGDVLRVVQYNVRGAVNTEGQVVPDDVARAIASSDPDVVILQEVARGWPVFGAGDLLARLEQRLDLPYRYEPAADGQFGNAILSRLPMTPVAEGQLPHVPGKQTRSYLIVALDAGAGRTVVVIGTHLETDASEQIDALLAAWSGTTPTVIAGDMNMDPSDTDNVQRFTDAGLVDAQGATGDPCRTTSAQPTSDCDRPSWVFVSADVSIADFRIGTVAASDHLPVHVALELPPA